MITIEQEDGDVWLVTVDAATKTQHRVTVNAANLARFGRGKIGARALLEASFRFLLGIFVLRFRSATGAS